ncbi:MAG: hypothetical protein [Bacteriophage sp.]|nr:MAG: hypothetical protein [Bacteriophage sp.]
MTIPKSYEALAADLASEKIISKTLLGQKEAYMKLADKGGLDLSESKAREAALREELALIIASFDELAACVDFSEARLDQTGDSPIDCANQIQQRLTVAEQREAELKKLLCDVINEAPTGFAALKVDLANRVNDALKPAAEGEGS